LENQLSSQNSQIEDTVKLFNEVMGEKESEVEKLTQDVSLKDTQVDEATKKNKRNLAKIKK
jgi:hypothetical protein